MQAYWVINRLKAGQRVLVGSLVIGCLCSSLARAQSVPRAPFDLDFAGVTVHLNETGRQQVQRELDRLYLNRDTLRRAVTLLQQLTPVLEPLLNRQRLPADYRYAASPFASDTSAYWALTTKQGAELGLRINPVVDERYHPIVATEAVAARLNNLHRTSGNYVQTLLNYLQVVQPTDRRIADVDSTYLMLDAQNSPRLIWKILARKLAYEQELPLSRSADQYLVYEYHQGEGQSIRAMARRLQLGEDRFEPFNHWLLARTLPTNKEYPVLIRVLTDEFPRVRSLADEQQTTSLSGQTDVGFPVLAKLPVQEVFPRLSAVYYTINDRLGIQAQSCDNVITLAYLGRLRLQALLSYNDLTENDLIQPGQIYYLAAKAKRAKIPFHIVQRNQTLREIAHMYGVRLKSLLRYNRIPPTQRVQTGRVVWLQRKRPRRQPVEYQQVAVDKTPIPSVVPPPIVAAASARPVSSVSVDSFRDSVITTTAKGRSLLKPKPVTESINRTKEDVDPVRLSVVLAPKPNRGKVVSKLTKLHVVKPGQTYFAIANLYGVAVRQLYSWNNLSDQIPLEVGQELIVGIGELSAGREVPKSGSVAAKPKAIPLSVPKRLISSLVDNPAVPVLYHVVKPGQTVYRVALLNNVSVPDLMRWNNLKDYSIEVGQRLVIRKQ